MVLFFGRYFGILFLRSFFSHHKKIPDEKDPNIKTSTSNGGEIDEMVTKVFDKNLYLSPDMVHVFEGLRDEGHSPFLTNEELPIHYIMLLECYMQESPATTMQASLSSEKFMSPATTGERATAKDVKMTQPYLHEQSFDVVAPTTVPTSHLIFLSVAEAGRFAEMLKLQNGAKNDGI